MEEPTKNSEDQTEDLTTDYANNTFFEASVWDLKIVFGEWSGQTKSVDWHTSMTIPWAQAKLMDYYLAVNVAAHELRMGKIPFPESMIPPEPQPPPDSEKNNPAAIAFYNMVREHRQKFLDSLGK
jgi:hypothetical protein